jgi:hypothetical protein
MSATMHWKPIPQPQEDNYIAQEVSWKLRKRLWEENGTAFSQELTVGTGLIPYLTGLMDACIEGAAELIAQIKEHGEIILYFEF